MLVTRCVISHRWVYGYRHDGRLSRCPQSLRGRAYSSIDPTFSSICNFLPTFAFQTECPSASLPLLCADV